MKNLFIVLLITLVFVGCNKDDDNNDNNSSVEGTWKLTAFNTENAYDFNGDGTASTNVMDETACYQNETVEFTSNSSGTATNRSYADITLDLITGSTTEYEYSVNCVPEVDIETFTWAQNGNNVVITSFDGPSTATLNGSELTFVIQSGFFVDVEDGSGGTTSITEDITIVYTKQ
ncbi:beta-barrel fold lipoprotein [Ulvibacter antarcticus]|uniref:Lipocalin-like protein n=1 Tax=Ulvibacter antarcticus TaxID=442714 RepID=A0A3L9Z2R2_9FLAO|nr:lipocalin family protein [Ulvibacter antarcticus]RMA66297.1 lipocalin-like protein [Ulvibacter antarcticus]